MTKQNPPKKKKFADLDNYFQDFSATASTTSTKQLPIDAKKLIEQDKVAKLREENNRKAAELAKQGYGYKGNVPQQGTVDYPATDRRSANYMGNPNMQFAAPNMKGQMRADAEGYHNDIIGGELAGLGIGAGISKGVGTLRNLKNVSKPINSSTNDVNKSFKSEIDWSKWNKEIPENNQLMKEYNAIEQSSKADGTWMKTEKGNPFYGTPEQFIQQKSSNWQKAFGKTKAKDYNNDSYILNHGTDNEFSEFSLDRFGNTDDGFYGKGVYLGKLDHNRGKDFIGKTADGLDILSGEPYHRYGEKQMKVYANIENPSPEEIIPFFGRDGKTYANKNSKDLISTRSLWEGKYDGNIVMPDNIFAEYVTHPQNIKSATGNNGMFDMTNPNIYKAVVPAAIGTRAALQYQQSKPLMADGGQLNNNGMINEYKGDSHFDPSGGIELNNAIVEDGELEYKGYVFSKDSEENKQLKKEMRLRKLRTDDDDYVPDAISRRSLNKAAILLVESHEKKRIDKLIADPETAENGIPPQGDMSLDPSADPSMMGQLPMMATGGFAPKVTTNQQYDQTFTVSGDAQNPDTPMSPISGQKGSKNYSGYIDTIGQAAGQASNLFGEDPYSDFNTSKATEVQGMQTGVDAVGSIIPFYGATKGVSALGESISNEGVSADNEPLQRTGSFIKGIDTFGTIMDSIDATDKGIISEEKNVGYQALNFLGGPWAQMALDNDKKEYYENQRKQQEHLAVLDNRDYGGTDMEAQGPRDRYMKYGGMRKKYMEGEGTKNDIHPNRQDFEFGEDILQYDPNSYITGTEVFDMSDNIDPDIEWQGDNFSKAHMAKAVSENPAILSAYDKSRELSSYPSGPTFSVSGSAQGPNTPMSMIGSSGKVDKIDWGNIGESVGMGLLGNIGNLAYLASEGKDYDKVSYDRFNPETVNASSSRRAIRDSMATSKEALRESGRLDRASLSQLSTQSAKQLADAEERIRLGNTGMMNDAQLKNLEIGMREQNDEAMNKGQALTNYYNALNAIGQNTQAAYRGNNLRMSDAEKQRLVAERNAQLQEYLKEFKTA